MSILILSEQFDFHGTAVRWGLEKLGERVDWWERALFPAGQTLSAAISDDQTLTLAISPPDVQRAYSTNCQCTTQPQRVSVSPNVYKTIWNRRGQVPRVGADLDETDKVVARTESSLLLKAILNVLEDHNRSALVVNRPNSIERVNPKIHQLHVARSIGFRIPNTLCSNDPEEVRQFFRGLNGDVVAKQHIPYAWRLQSGAIAFTGTTKITSKLLESDFSISGSPLTYQQHIEMRSELRVIAFGRTIFAVEQERYARKVGEFADVRWEGFVGKRFDVDATLREKIFAYMNVMGLNYGAFDIAITVDGEYVFLESNECGQFLYLEEMDPSLPMLDAFCRFLASGDPGFEYTPDPASLITMKSFEETDAGKTFERERIAFERLSTKLSPFELQE